MATPSKCSQNRDPLRLVREGTAQDQRFPAALDPEYAPVDARKPEHAMVLAQKYSEYLRYFATNNVVTGNWQPFFSEDVAVLLAHAAIQNLTDYRSHIKQYFSVLDDPDNPDEQLQNHLGYLFSSLATLAHQLDGLKNSLPEDIALKKTLRNLIVQQLAPAFRQLLLYYRDGLNPVPPPAGPYVTDISPADQADNNDPDFRILGAMMRFSEVREQGLSADWIAVDPADANDWDSYLALLDDPLQFPPSIIYGTGPTLFERINHIATHNLFTSLFDQFLKAYARTVGDAKKQLQQAFTNRDDHEPHYTLFLAFLRLFEYAQAEINTLTERHLDFYYREILQLKGKPAEPGKVHLLVELARQTSSHLLKTGERFKAGKDALGKDVFYTSDRDFVANQAQLAELKTVYQHDAEALNNPAFPDADNSGRLYASPVANSDDGIGAELTTPDQSWHPFYNKIYQSGELFEIKMPQVEIGFALASHYLLLAGGERTITLDITTDGLSPPLASRKDDVICLLSVVDGWLEKSALDFKTVAGKLRLKLKVTGADPAIKPYTAKVHGYNFATQLPVLLVKLKHREDEPFVYDLLRDIKVKQIELTVEVKELKTLAVSNDFGPVDTSKPFQPYGALPSKGSSLIIGSKELFQKKLTTASVVVSWLTQPVGYQSLPHIKIDFLSAGQWEPSEIRALAADETEYELSNNLNLSVIDQPDLNPDEYYGVTSRHGFVRLYLTDDLGQKAYQDALIEYIKNSAEDQAPEPPVVPVINEIKLDYTAKQSIVLNSADAEVFAKRVAYFFHLAPFGQAERHRYLTSKDDIFLLPRFDFQRDNEVHKSAAEFYIGITGLQPPQNLSLLFQVADGTADPLTIKPDPHIHWSYLINNEWIPFANNEVEDATGGLLVSGIITFAMPRAASNTNTLLPGGLYWIRAAVSAETDAVCRLIDVAAQALPATFSDQNNDPEFPANILPAGTIAKLDRPTAAVKKIIQPFDGFGGRGREDAAAFYTRVSERLRHKDRAISLWDYERLILQAFPQIYKVRCLNHTRYEPDSSGAGIYRELAPGHVSIVTIVNQQQQNLRNPLRPFTSLGLLHEIETFLRKRLSCFVTLHVRNPQFEEVHTVFKVRLYDGFDETFYTNELQQTLTRYLSPWAYSGGGSPSFSGKIYKSVLINFVEELPYVDYVTDFQLFHTFFDQEGKQQTLKKNEVEGSKAVSILVSVPAAKHEVQIIKFTENPQTGESCPCQP